VVVPTVWLPVLQLHHSNSTTATAAATATTATCTTTHTDSATAAACSCRPELLALHLQQWLSFFGDDDPSSSSSSSSSSGGPGLRARLAASPQLLAVDAERLVGNLYELGAMVAAEVRG
jgi:hypothetical protein